tara:strand:- start:128 stop:340 length:213 start_codon:yes stop_codon:yes gene_type:complete
MYVAYSGKLPQPQRVYKGAKLDLILSLAASIRADSFRNFLDLESSPVRNLLTPLTKYDHPGMSKSPGISF